MNQYDINRAQKVEIAKRWGDYYRAISVDYHPHKYVTVPDFTDLEEKPNGQ